MSKTPRLNLLAAAVCCMFLLASFAPSAGAQQDDATEPAEDSDPVWGVAPGRDAEAGSRRPFFVYDVAPGDTIHDTVTLINFGDEPINFLLYATDAFVSIDGGFGLLNRDIDPIDIGTWVDIDVFDYTVDPGESADIPFTVNVPAEASPGDHVGGIVVENLTEQADVTVDDEGVDVALQRRIGARIYARVEGPIGPRLLIESIEVDHDQPLFSTLSGQGHATVRYEVKNNGNVVLDPSAVIEIKGIFGRTVARIERDVPELLPQSSVVLTDELTDAAGLPPLDKLTVEITLTAEDVEVTRSAGTWAISWGVVILLLGLLLMTVLWRRLRRHPGPEDDDPPLTQRRERVPVSA